MKKLIKAAIAASLAVSGVVSYMPDSYVVASAKVFQDFTYQLTDQGTVEIINYNGHETRLEIPAMIDGLPVTSIGYGTFAECVGLEEVIIPETVTNIDDWAFSKCTSLKTISLPDSIVFMDKNVFSGCYSLESVKLPKTLKSIPYGTFYQCENLKNVIYPDNVELIDGLAFSGCKSLSDIEIHDTVKTIGNSAFSNCISLKSVTVPEGTKTIGASIFSGCINLTDVNLPESLEGIGQYAFKDCISLESIYLPDGLYAIGYSTFTGCSDLKNVNIPTKNLTNLSNALFSGCSSLKNIDIPENITELGSNVFSGCVGLESIYLPDSITSMGSEVFSFCSLLKEVRLPSKITELSYDFFKSCESLETVFLPGSLKKLDNTVFVDCISLKSVAIPNSVSSLGSRVFSGAKNVTVMVGQGSAAYKYAVNNRVNYTFFKNGLNFNAKELNLKEGNTFELTAISYPTYTVVGDSTLTWSSTNDAVASVDKNGVITANGVGQATIRAIGENQMVAECVVNVDNEERPIESIEIITTETSNEIAKGKAKQLRARINPSDTTDPRNLTWTSSDNEVATVSSTGTITTHKAGNATIKVEASNGVYDTYDIVVVSPIATVSLSATGMELEEGESRVLRASINPYDTTDDTTLTWKSSNENVATVDQEGNVKAVARGTATITVRTVNNRTAECKVTVNKVQDIEVRSVELDKKSLTLTEGDSDKLTATINPTNATNRNLTWSSSEEEVAIVDPSGVITAIAPGTTTITVTTHNGLTDTCIVTVEERIVEVEGIALDKHELTLVEEETGTLTATINPEDATDQTLTWTTDAPEVATVEDGVVTAVAPGTATITVATSNGLTDTCVVTVERKVIEVESVTLDKHELTLVEETEGALTATINPEDATDQTLTWTTDAPEVATVENGVVTAVAPGTATITVTTSNGLTDTCVVTVERKFIEVESVTLDRNELTLIAGNSDTLVATINPEDATDPSLTWTTDAPEVATVENGVVTAVGAGFATITVTTSNGLTAECTVTVIQYADYSRVDELIEKAEALDSSKYTAESYAAVMEAVEAVVRDYEIDKQDEVNAMADAIETAIDALVREYTVTMNGEEVARGVYNTKVTLEAPVVEGKEFTGWLFNGKVISTQASYTFFLSEDMELTPSYGEVEVEPLAMLVNAHLTKREDTKADIKFVGQLVVPEGYTIKNAGLVWSSKEGTELSLDNESLKPTYITAISKSNQFSVTIKGMPAGKFIRGRIFVTFVDADGEEVVVYSDETRVVNE